jgi:predicted metal-dependent hydrolase
MTPDPRFQEGVEHFNRRDYYAAHDAWESLWLERFGEEKDFLQGLILCAVALLHYRRSNFRGARSRFRAALERLEPYPDVYAGVDLRNFRRRMNGVLHRVLEEENPPPLRESSVPKIRIEA